MLLICARLDVCNIAFELAQPDFLVKTFKERVVSIATFETCEQIGGTTYSSSISPGVLRATSGSINQQMVTAILPDAAKLLFASFKVSYA